MNKRTPGPWGINQYVTGSFRHLNIVSDSGEIAITTWINNNNQTRANANLIAAAPDLLDALEKLALETSARGMTANQHEALINARAAIAKAKGE